MADNSELILDNAPPSPTFAAHLVATLRNQHALIERLSLVNCNLASIPRDFPHLPNLHTLNLADNRMHAHDALSPLPSSCPHLASLDLSNNRFDSLDALLPLKAMASVTSLSLLECPLTLRTYPGDNSSTATYRQTLFAILPHVQVIDGHDRLGNEVDMSSSSSASASDHGSDESDGAPGKHGPSDASPGQDDSADSEDDDSLNNDEELPYRRAGKGAPVMLQRTQQRTVSAMRDPHRQNGNGSHIEHTSTIPDGRMRVSGKGMMARNATGGRSIESKSTHAGHRIAGKGFPRQLSLASESDANSADETFEDEDDEEDDETAEKGKGTPSKGRQQGKAPYRFGDVDVRDDDDDDEELDDEEEANGDSIDDDQVLRSAFLDRSSPIAANLNDPAASEQAPQDKAAEETEENIPTSDEDDDDDDDEEEAEEDGDLEQYDEDDEDQQAAEDEDDNDDEEEDEEIDSQEEEERDEDEDDEEDDEEDEDESFSTTAQQLQDRLNAQHPPDQLVSGGTGVLAGGLDDEHEVLLMPSSADNFLTFPMARAAGAMPPPSDTLFDSPGNGLDSLPFGLPSDAPSLNNASPHDSVPDVLPPPRAHLFDLDTASGLDLHSEQTLASLMSGNDNIGLEYLYQVPVRRHEVVQLTATDAMHMRQDMPDDEMENADEYTFSEAHPDNNVDEDEEEEEEEEEDDQEQDGTEQLQRGVKRKDDSSSDDDGEEDSGDDARKRLRQ
ncbi:Acidic leucine-rich nuclear phosphoprotein 32 member [Sorochytrium milnesiophthora]